MRQPFRTLVMVVTVSVIAANLVPAQTKNVHVGTWNLNVAKSKFDPGPPFQSQTLRFEEWEGGLKATADAVDAKGQKAHLEFAAKFDGKPYPFTGNPDGDMLTMKRIDDRTIETAWTLKGKPTITARGAVAADGKTRTVTYTGTNAAGQKVNQTLVYDRQM